MTIILIKTINKACFGGVCFVVRAFDTFNSNASFKAQSDCGQDDRSTVTFAEVMVCSTTVTSRVFDGTLDLHPRLIPFSFPFLRVHVRLHHLVTLLCR